MRNLLLLLVIWRYLLTMLEAAMSWRTVLLVVWLLLRLAIALLLLLWRIGILLLVSALVVLLLGRTILALGRVALLGSSVLVWVLIVLVVRSRHVACSVSVRL
jgi:hypothetical protein